MPSTYYFSKGFRVCCVVYRGTSKIILVKETNNYYILQDLEMHSVVWHWLHWFLHAFYSATGIEMNLWKYWFYPKCMWTFRELRAQNLWENLLSGGIFFSSTLLLIGFCFCIYIWHESRFPGIGFICRYVYAIY